MRRTTLVVALSLMLSGVGCVSPDGDGHLDGPRTFIDDTERPADDVPSTAATVAVALDGDDDPVMVTVDVVEGLLLFEGDIVMGVSGDLTPLGMVHSRRDRVWPGGVVPFTISDELSVTMRGRIENAIDHWEDRTPLRFVPRTDEADFVAFISSDTMCASFVGRTGGEQSVWLAPACGQGSVIHEIGHAVGLWHEQSRNDREAYVEIVYENILEGRAHNFDQMGTLGLDTPRFVGDYDFDSIMHYGAFAFGRVGEDGLRLQTIETIPAGIPIGQRGGLSAADVFAVEQLYVPPRLMWFRATPGEIDVGGEIEFEWLVEEPSAHDLRCLIVVEGAERHEYELSADACDGRHVLAHAFDAVGEYQVHMTVDDGIGVVVTTTVTVYVVDAGPAPVPDGFAVYVGADRSSSQLAGCTYPGGCEFWANLVFVLDLDSDLAPLAEDAAVEFVGPMATALRAFRLDEGGLRWDLGQVVPAGSHWAAFSVMGPSDAEAWAGGSAIPGDYTVRLHLGGTTHERTVSLGQAAALAGPADLSAELHEDTVSASWAPVAGTVTYRADLFDVTHSVLDGPPMRLERTYPRGASAGLGVSGLTGNELLQVQVLASNWSLDGPRDAPYPGTIPATVEISPLATATVTVVDLEEAWRFDPAQLDFVGEAGGAAPAGQTIRLHNEATVARTFTLSSSGMVGLSPVSGSVPAGGFVTIEVTVEACPVGDSPGTTTSVITATGGGGTGMAGVARVCGEAPADAGMILVTITGLPAGVEADVFIEGQGWMLWPTSSVLLADMPTGQYQMTADSVSSGGTSYHPSPTSSAFTVTTGNTTEVPIAYGAPANQPPVVTDLWVGSSSDRFECGGFVPDDYVTFRWVAADPDGDAVTYQYRVDAGAWVSRSSTSVTVTFFDANWHTFDIRAIDSQQNVSVARSCQVRVSREPEVLGYGGPEGADYSVGESVPFLVETRDLDGHYPSSVYLWVYNSSGGVVLSGELGLFMDQGPAVKLTYAGSGTIQAAGDYRYVIAVTDALGYKAAATPWVDFVISP